jgi:uncharacterized protein (DUF433 family)
VTIEPQPIPLRQDETGAIRIGRTRVLLDLVIRAYQDGATPECIVSRYDTLRVADVYAVIGYYLTHRQEIDDYLHHRELEAAELRECIEASQRPRPGLREELLARLAVKEEGHVPADQ